jgi:hypothetical protein
MEAQAVLAVVVAVVVMAAEVLVVYLFITREKLNVIFCNS